MSGPTGFLDNVNRSFDRAAAFTGFPQGLLDEIKAGNSLYRFEFPLRHDDGSITVVQGGGTAGTTPTVFTTPAIEFKAMPGDRLILQFDEVLAGTPTVDAIITVEPA